MVKRHFKVANDGRGWHFNKDFPDRRGKAMLHSLAAQGIKIGHIESAAKKYYPYQDWDRDGKVNRFDCHPLDENRQDFKHTMKKVDKGFAKFKHTIKEKLEERKEKKEEALEKKHDELAKELNVQRRHLKEIAERQEEELKRRRAVEGLQEEVAAQREELAELKKEAFAQTTAGKAIAAVESGVGSAVEYEREHLPSQLGAVKGFFSMRPPERPAYVQQEQPEAPEQASMPADTYRAREAEWKAQHDAEAKRKIAPQWDTPFWDF